MDEAGVSHGAKQREAAPQSAKAYCVSLLACLLGATLLATGAVTAPFAFALSLFSLEPVVFCTPSLSSLVPFSLSLRVASPRWQDAPSPTTLPRRAALLEARADQLPASNRSCPHRACCSYAPVLSVERARLGWSRNDRRARVWIVGACLVGRVVG